MGQWSRYGIRISTQTTNGADMNTKPQCLVPRTVVTRHILTRPKAKRTPMVSHLINSNVEIDVKVA